MKTIRKIKIISFYEQTRILQRRATPEIDWCPECNRETLMLTPRVAEKKLGISSRTLFRWVEAGKLHFTERPDGKLFICSNSVTAIDTSQSSIL